MESFPLSYLMYQCFKNKMIKYGNWLYKYYEILFQVLHMQCHVLSCVSEYVTELMDRLFNEVIHDPAPFVAELKEVDVPAFLCSHYERPEKAYAIAKHVSRFSHPGPALDEHSAPTHGNEC